MAHFAKIDNKIVTSVIVINDDDCGNLPYPESEALGQQAIANYGISGQWLQTSYNTRHGQHPTGRGFRKNFAGIGYTYDPDRDAFIPPKYYPSWVFNEETCDWEAPVPQPVTQPGDGQHVEWIEEEQNWRVYQLGQ